jgi:hypothetical protein
MLQIDYIGTKTTIPGWPENTIEGLFDALERWELDGRLNHAGDPRFTPHPDRKPFRWPALRSGGSSYSQELGCAVYLDGPPIYPDAPDAVSYCGNFVGYSFGFHLTTDDRALIERLDAAIAKNLQAYA